MLVIIVIIYFFFHKLGQQQGGNTFLDIFSSKHSETKFYFLHKNPISHKAKIKNLSVVFWRKKISTFLTKTRQNKRSSAICSLKQSFTNFSKFFYWKSSKKVIHQCVTQQKKLWLKSRNLSFFPFQIWCPRFCVQNWKDHFWVGIQSGRRRRRRDAQPDSKIETRTWWWFFFFFQFWLWCAAMTLYEFDDSRCVDIID